MSRRLAGRVAAGRPAPPSPFEPGLDGAAMPPPAPAVQAHEGEERLERQPHAEGEANERAARQHAGDAVEDARRVARAEEHVEERGLVVVPDEAQERPDALVN